LHEEVCAEVNSWISALLSASTLISVSGEKTRTSFFNTQREILHSLLWSDSTLRYYIEHATYADINIP